MYLEKRLEQLSEDNNEIKKLFGIWCVLKEHFIQILEGVTQYFPHFSLHNESHSKTISQQIERIIGKNRIDQLSATDIWLLLMSFYSHDIGMAVKYEDVYEFFTSNNCENILTDYATGKKSDVSEAAKRLLQFGMFDVKNKYEQSIQHFNDMRLVIETHFRGLHATKSKEYIDVLMDSFNKYSIINIRFIQLLGDICVSHQKDVSCILDLPYKTNGLFEDYAHPRFIAGMLCLGDLLDLDTDRFNESMLDIIDPLPESSKSHMLKHKAIKHFLVDSNGIEILSDTENEEANRELKVWTQYLQNIIQYLCLNWENIAPENFGLPPKIKSIKHLKAGNENWSDYLSLAFTIEKNKAFELLQGANIYKNKFAFVKEVIQNSIDASILQMWYELHNNDPKKYNVNTKITEIAKKEFDKFPIDIELKYTEEGRCVFIIRDSGIGIDANDLRNMSTVGNSNTLKKKHILNCMPNWLKPSGAFGIGLQSIFMITDSFEVVSKTDNDISKIIKFESGNYNNGYISINDYTEYFSRGTKVIIQIDNKKLKLNDFYYDNNLILKFRTLDNLAANSIYSSLFRSVAYKQYDKEYKYSFFNINLKAEEYGREVLEEKISENLLFDNVSNVNMPFDDKHDFEFSYYDNENDILCRISLNKPFSKNGNNDIQFIRSNNKFKHAIYFRNICIKDYSSDRYYNKSLYKYVDFEINILNYKSVEMLKISRDSFSREGKAKTQEIIKRTIKKVLCSYIDKLLISNIKLKEYGICLLQICEILDFKKADFINKFLEEIKNYKYGAFSSYSENEENKEKLVKYDLSYEVLDLLSNEYTVIVKRYNKDFVGEQVLSLLPKITNINETILNKDIDEHYSENVISNRIIAKQFMICDDYIYECLRIKPLSISEDYLPTYDEINKIILYVTAIKNSQRSIDGQKDYEDLSVLEGTDGYASYRIELPFVESDFIFLKEQLYSRHENNFRKNDFIKHIKESKYFEAVTSFISENNEKSCEDIREQMIKLLNEIIELIFENKLFEKNVTNVLNNVP